VFGREKEAKLGSYVLPGPQMKAWKRQKERTKERMWIKKGHWSSIFVVHTRMRERQTNYWMSLTRGNADFSQGAYWTVCTCWMECWKYLWNEV